MKKMDEPEFDSLLAAIYYLEGPSPEISAFRLSPEVSGRIYELHEICQKLLQDAKAGVPGYFSMAGVVLGYFRTLFSAASGNLPEAGSGIKAMIKNANAVSERGRTVTERYNALVALDHALVEEIELFNRFGAAVRRRHFDGIPICAYMGADRADRMRFHPDQFGGCYFEFELYPKITNAL